LSETVNLQFGKPSSVIIRIAVTKLDY